MERQKIVAVLIGLAVAVFAAAGVFWFNRGSHLVLDGTVQKIRTLGLDSMTAMIVDFRVTNNANYNFVVKTIELIAEIDGQPVEGFLVAEMDAKRFFDNFPAMGQKYNDTLKLRERIVPGQTVDRMLAARFDVPEAKLKSRTNLTIRITEADGVVTEIRTQ